MAELLVAVALIATFAGGFGLGRISGARRQSRELVAWSRSRVTRVMPPNPGESRKAYEQRRDFEAYTIAGAELFRRQAERRG